MIKLYIENKPRHGEFDISITGFLRAGKLGEESKFSDVIFLQLIFTRRDSNSPFKVYSKLNCENLLTLHRVYSDFFFNVNPSLHAV